LFCRQKSDTRVRSVVTKTLLIISVTTKNMSWKRWRRILKIPSTKHRRSRRCLRVFTTRRTKSAYAAKFGVGVWRARILFKNHKSIYVTCTHVYIYMCLAVSVSKYVPRLCIDFDFMNYVHSNTCSTPVFFIIIIIIIISLFFQ